MEIFGFNFGLRLGSWKLRFACGIEDDDLSSPVRSATKTPHRLRVVETAQR